MKAGLLILVALCFVSCDNVSGPGGGQFSPWTLRDDMVNFGILIVDSESHAFDGGALVQLPPCQGCDSERMPLATQAVGYGRRLELTALVYTATGDTVWYMLESPEGPGAILMPDSLDAPGEFSLVHRAEVMPTEVECVYSPSCTLSTASRAAFETAWDKVADLGVVREFGERSYRVKFLEYVPAARNREVYPDKWVIILYRGAVAG